MADQVGALLRDYGRGGMGGFMRWLPQRDRLKSKVAALIGASAEEIGFVQSTTAGVHQIAHSLPWRAGDRVVLFEGEFPANVTPWQRAAAEYDLELCFVPIAPFLRSKSEGLDALRRVLRHGARLVAVSAVQFQTGLRMPLGDIAAMCRGVGAELFVDAIQQLGVAPLSVGDGIDYLASGGHKWLMGLEGAGFVYVSKPCAQRLVPRLAGWLSHEDGLRFLFEGAGHLRTDRPFLKEAAVVEQGAQSNTGLVALEAGLDLIQQLGVDAIFDHVQQFHDRLEPALRSRGFTSARASETDMRSGSLCVRSSRQDVGVVHERLGAAGIVTSTPDGWLRFAPHWPNSLAEVDAIVAAL